MTHLRRSLVLALTVAVALPLALTASIAIAPAPSLTEAAWTDAEFASGTLTAATLRPPEITDCQALSGILNLYPKVILTWTVDTDIVGVAPSSYEFFLRVNGLLTLLPFGTNGVSTSVANGVYTTTFSLGLLDGLVSASAEIGVATTLGNWTSPVIRRYANWPLLGSNTCSA